MNKRGNWVDVFEYGRGALVLGISILIVFIMLNSFNDMIITSAVNNTMLNDSDALDTMQGTVDVFPSATDFILPIIYIFFLGFSAWAARKIDSSHKFIFIAFIVILIAVMFAMFIETMWTAFTETAIIAAQMGSFPITNIMLSYLRYFVLFYGIIVGVALYAKKT